MCFRGNWTASRAETAVPVPPRQAEHVEAWGGAGSAPKDACQPLWGSHGNKEVEGEALAGDRRRYWKPDMGGEGWEARLDI